MELEMVSQHGALLKVGLFVLVQALVYLILAQSSSVFSITKTLGLPSTRALSARRMVALLSDLPLALAPRRHHGAVVARGPGRARPPEEGLVNVSYPHHSLI
uniref:Uncharacterized protein n=1 Tax=Triticum urartu TaxID=4572 RepID=A0A8R7UG58_TRIUA